MPMKSMRRIICLLLACLMLTACNTTAPDSSGAALDTQKNLEQIALLGTSPDDNYRTFYEVFVYLYLQRIHFVICSFHSCFVQLQLNIVVVAKKVLVPHYGFFCFVQLSVFY